MSEKLESHLCHLLPCTAIWASVVVGEGGGSGDLRPVCQKGVGIQQPLEQGRAGQTW